jgi:hypothetical protein
MLASAPDRWARMIRRALLAGVGPAASAAGYLYYNYLRFGGLTQFGYTDSKERLAIHAAQNAQAIIAYLLSPSLSLFLFAPPLILALAAGRWAFRRWPLESGALIVAAIAQLLLFSCYASWSGDVGYGPRFMFEAIVMLTPLTLPAFEAVADSRSRRATMTVAALAGFGLAVQLIGVAVYQTVNEWYRANQGIFDNNAFVFVPSASPIIVDIRALAAGQHLAPWALRAWAHPGPALVLWIGLAIMVVGARAGWLLTFARRMPILGYTIRSACRRRLCSRPYCRFSPDLCWCARSQMPPACALTTF